MTKKTIFAIGTLILIVAVARIPAQGGKYHLKVVDVPPPKEVSEGIQKLLAKKSIQVLDEQNKALCEIWLRQELPSDADAAQVKNGLTYRELKSSEVLGAIRFDQDWYDYRKQKVKAGVYTLRLAFQPQDGDHMGASEFTEFGLLVAADKDTKPGLLEGKHMYELSMKSISTGHPAVFMLFPNTKPADAPELVTKPRNHWVVNVKEPVDAKGTKTAIGISLTVVGSAE